jgi:hypothetical protein
MLDLNHGEYTSHTILTLSEGRRIQEKITVILASLEPETLWKALLQISFGVVVLVES